MVVFFFKQKTAYEMRISDWSSDVCSSDLYASDRVEAIGSFEDREEARAALGAFRKILRRFGFAAILLSVAAAIYGFYGQKPTAYIIAIWPLLLFLFFSHEKIKAIFNSEERCVGTECVST